MTADVEKVIHEGKPIKLYPRLAETDILNRPDEANVLIAWEDGKGNPFTPDEVEELFANNMTAGLRRYMDGTLYPTIMRFRYYYHAIVCGTIRPSLKETMPPKILDYAKKMGYVTDNMTPLKMMSGTKSLIFNPDGTYSISYKWHDSVLNDIEPEVRETFTKDFFTQRSAKVEFMNDGIVMANLSEAGAFSSNDLFRRYDTILNFLAKKYDKEILLRTLAFRLALSGKTDALMLNNSGNIKLPLDRHTSFAFNEFGVSELNCSKAILDESFSSYSYIIKVPYSEGIRELLLLTVKLLNMNHGVNAEFCGHQKGIVIDYENKELFPVIERELLSLDYAITLFEMEPYFPLNYLEGSLIDLFEADSTGYFEKIRKSALKLLQAALRQEETSEKCAAFQQAYNSLWQAIKEVFAEIFN